MSTDSSDLAIVGTGTGVGKTVVTAGLVGWYREAGIDACAIKPVQTGHPPDDDAAFVASACETDRAATCLRYLEAPLAPAVAAEQEEVKLSYADIIANCRSALAESEIGILEGIGGLRVPLASVDTNGSDITAERPDREVLDLVADLGLPAVVVARSGLGTLNHTALTVTALERRGIEVRAAVCNEYEGNTVAEQTNPAVLERMTGVPVYTLPPVDLSDSEAAITLIGKHLSMSNLDPTLNQ